RALEILGAIFPADSEDLALCRRRLALLHQQQGLFALAETRGHESLDIRRRLFGDIHPRVAESLETLARGLRLQGKNEEALELAAQAFWVRQQHFEHNADARERSGPGDDLAVYRQESDSLLNWAERLEAELARAGADVVSGRAEEQVSADRIAAELPEDASLVEFYRCRSEDPIDGLKDDGLMLIAPDCTRRPSPVSARRPRIRRHGGSPCAGARACIPSAVSMKRRWPT
ncbi:MAG: tetratricopeptide repeat protein, partial [Candidatus Eisenbacteria sp.]|nr:tetratricopeptide repeat protein [Candidatus Eisenbacteria bacterium]